MDFEEWKKLGFPNKKKVAQHFRDRVQRTDGTDEEIFSIWERFGGDGADAMHFLFWHREMPIKDVLEKLASIKIFDGSDELK